MIKTARHRERSLLNPVEVYLDREQYGVHEDKGPHTVAFSYEVCDDYVVDDYHRRIAAGEIINNPCVYSKSSMSSEGDGKIIYSVGGAAQSTLTGKVTTRLHELGYITPSLNLSISSREDRCKLVALANIDSTPYAFGEDALELRETMRFLRNPLTSLVKLSRQFRRSYLSASNGLWKRGAARNSYKLLQAHASVYLQYRFALSPLIRSSIDALDAYQSKPPQPSPRHSARGIVRQDDIVTATDQKESGLGHLFSQEHSLELDEKASILYAVRNPVYDWKYRLGFRPKDLPTTLWQVMPYSFMVDRLYDITSFSKGAINLGDPNVTILSGCFRSKKKRVQKWTLTGRDHPTATSVPYADTEVFEDFDYQRDVWVPSFSDTIPSVTLGEVVKDATNIADLTALIVSNFDPFNQKR